ncbi:hypothetical protein BASA62_006579 [Batrachochytrium salamandrivorans]|nr:hypothetical protein BASA62_006579 [Batrachochytrium salamandrivorans]
MKFSTGVILSILSANVFAIEHLNGAHSGSLLARRAVVADTDGTFLQKRNNGKEQEEQEEQAKPKTSVPNPDSSQKPYVYVKDTFDFYKSYKPGDSTQEGPTAFPLYVLTQDDKGKGARKKVYAGLGSGRGKSRFGDAPGGSPSHALGSIKNGLYRARLRFELFASRQSAFSTFEEIKLHFGGEEGIAIGKEVHEMLKYALTTSHSYKILYSDLIKSPFRLKLLPSTSDELKQKYEGFQDNVHGHIKKHISAIDTAIECIAVEPKHVISGLEKLMKQTDRFYGFISKVKFDYPGWLRQLKISNDGHLEDLEMHTMEVEKYKDDLSDRFSTIKEMVDDYITNSNQRSTSKALSSSLESKKHPEVESKPSKDGASSSAPSESEASSSAPSEDGVVYNLIDFSDDE